MFLALSFLDVLTLVKTIMIQHLLVKLKLHNLLASRYRIPIVSTSKLNKLWKNFGDIGLAR